jgi:transposase
VTKIICGVDVASRFVQARIGPEGPAGRFANTAKGIAELAVFCRQHQVELVAMEATGGYEKRPFALLWAQGIAVAILNPRAVRRFAEGMGLLEKTDRIDAGMIAWFAQVKCVAAMAPLSAEQQRLKALVVRLRQLTAMRTAQRNQQRLVEEAGSDVSLHQRRGRPHGSAPGGGDAGNRNCFQQSYFQTRRLGTYGP